MANTYSQIHLHVVFAVQNRESIISKHWKDKLYKYITGIVQNSGHKMIIINGMMDHVHILIGLRPMESVSDLVKKIKRDSSNWINDEKLARGKFSWQEGYGVFSYSKSQLPNVIEYIKNQEEHHRGKTFREEYIRFLELYEVDFDERYVFHNIDVDTDAG